MHILFIHHNGSSGGASNSLYELIKALKEPGINISIITPKGTVVSLFSEFSDNIFTFNKGNPPTFFTAEGIKFIQFRSGFAFFQNLENWRFIQKKISEIKPDIVHLNDSGLFYLAKGAKKMGCKVVMHARTAPSNAAFLTNLLINKYISKYVDYLFPISGSVSRLYKGKINKEIIYNPYKLDDSVVNSERDSKRLNCLFLANFIDYKGVDEVIGAAVKLRENKDIYFYLAGANVKNNMFFGSPKGYIVNKLGIYPNYEQKIRNTIKKYNLSNIILLGYESNIEKLFTNTHVMIAPFRLNSPPRCVFEAGVYGIPTILSLKNKVEDLIEHMHNGLIINQKSSKELAESIQFLYENENTRNYLGKNAKAKYRLLHNPLIIKKKVLDIYKKILSF